MTQPGKLYLLPNLLGDHKGWEQFLPPPVAEAVSQLDGLIAESDQGGRSYLYRFRTKKPPNLIPLALFNEHSKPGGIDFLLEPLLKGETWGLVSDAGLPCIADPGAQLVYQARQLGIAIEAFSGPSAITLSLMLSGFPGQHFTFHGYLQRDRNAHLLQMESDSSKQNSTQLFIEAPYRNLPTLEAALQCLHPTTRLCVACDLTLPTELVLSQTIQQWRTQNRPDIRKRPAIFLICGQGGVAPLDPPPKGGPFGNPSRNNKRGFKSRRGGSGE